MGDKDDEQQFWDDYPAWLNSSWWTMILMLVAVAVGVMVAYLWTLPSIEW